MFRDVRLDGYFRGLEVKARRLGIYLAQQCDQVVVWCGLNKLEPLGGGAFGLSKPRGSGAGCSPGSSASRPLDMWMVLGSLGRLSRTLAGQDLMWLGGRVWGSRSETCRFQRRQGSGLESVCVSGSPTRWRSVVHLEQLLIAAAQRRRITIYAPSLDTRVD